MQPPTEPLQHQTTDDQLRGDEAELYQRHHQQLVRAISAAVNASAELIEDACQTAWTTLLRRQPNRPAVWSWRYIVALHEADQRLRHMEQRPASAGPAAATGSRRPGPPAWPSRPAGANRSA